MNNLTPPDGMEIDLEKSKIVFKPIKKKIEWEDFGVVNGYFITSVSTIQEISIALSGISNCNTIPTREEAEAILALIQLMQWRDKRNEGWKPDWTEEQGKSYIRFKNNEPRIDYTETISRPLTFKTRVIAEQFLTDFRDLIMKARPVL